MNQLHVTLYFELFMYKKIVNTMLYNLQFNTWLLVLYNKLLEKRTSYDYYIKSQQIDTDIQTTIV